MKPTSEAFVRQNRDGERGQSLVLVASLLVAVMAACAVVLDFGYIYYSYEQLVAATDAAALAGGAAIPAGTAVAVATQYSASTTGDNAHPNLQSVTTTATLECLSIPTGSGLPICLTYGAQPSANAIVVTEKATVSTFFAKIFGVNSLNISATATASAKGGGGGPYNIMMVLDTTNSMGTNYDTSCTVPGVRGAPTAEQCAQYGIQQLLGELDPCSTALTTCGTVTNGNVPNPVDQVGLMAFPGLCADTATKVTTGNCPNATTLTDTVANSTYAPDDYACPTTAPPIAAYNNDPEYLILPLQSNYRTVDTAATLNASADIVKSIGAGIGSCSGVTTPGGEGTFYAGAIQAAQDYLSANNRQNVQNVIILLSDGDATASASQMGGKVTSYPATSECQQAVTAANNAKKVLGGNGLGTLVYSVSYGSETSGCTAGDTLTPCGTMLAIASLPTNQYFFSVPQTVKGVTSTVCSGARSTTTLDQVFTDIAGDLTTARLIPNNTP